MDKYAKYFVLIISLSLNLYSNCRAADFISEESHIAPTKKSTSLKRSRDSDKEEKEVEVKVPHLDPSIPFSAPKEIPEAVSKQTFGMPTLDAAFKYLLHDDKILLEFIKLFGEEPTITSAKLLDQSLNPIKELKKARSVLSSKDTKDFFETVAGTNKKDLRIQVHDDDKKWKAIPNGVNLLKDLSEIYPEIREAVPDIERNSQLDVVCQLSNNDFVMVEVQVALQDYWDARALAYAGAFYGNQLKKGGEWKDLKKVIAINILGGGNEETHYWKDAPNELMRHYQFISDVDGKKHVIDFLQLIQYNVMFSKLEAIANPALREWVEFLQQAHKKNDADLAKVKTAVVKQAYERIRIKAMPENVMQQYIDQYKDYEKYSRFITKEKEASHKKGFEEGVEKGIEKGIEQGRKEEAKSMALRMLAKGMLEKEVANLTELPLEHVQELKASLKTNKGV